MRRVTEGIKGGINGMVLIGRKFQIDGDALNLCISKRHHVKATPTKPAHDYWLPLAYFATVKEALKFLVDHEIRGTGFDTFKAICKKQDELYELISSLKI